MDLSANYMSLELRSPLVPSASPLTMDLGALRQMEDAGAGAVVLASLFEEQIEHDAAELDHYLHYGADRFAESLSYFPEVGEFRLGAEEYLEHVAKAREAVDVPVIASLNGVSARGWTAYAEKMQQAGAAAIELNVYFLPTNAELTSQQVEDVYLDALKAVKGSVTIPVAMKLSPYLSCTPSMAQRLDEAGADALVLFNRFYQPDIDPESLEVKLNVDLSRPADNRLPLRWIAILYGNVKASLAATSGIHTAADAAKMIMAGADVAMMCSALLEGGIQHLRGVRDGLAGIAESHGYASLAEMKGVMSQKNCPEPAAYERGNYLRALTTFGPTATLE